MCDLFAVQTSSSSATSTTTSNTSSTPAPQPPQVTPSQGAEAGTTGQAPPFMAAFGGLGGGDFQAQMSQMQQVSVLGPTTLCSRPSVLKTLYQQYILKVW